MSHDGTKPPQPTFIHPSTPLYCRRRRWVGPKCILLLRNGAVQCGQWIRSLFSNLSQRLQDGWRFYLMRIVGLENKVETFALVLILPRFVAC